MEPFYPYTPRTEPLLVSLHRFASYVIALKLSVLMNSLPCDASVKASRNIAELRRAAETVFSRIDTSSWTQRRLSDDSRPRCGVCNGQMTLRVLLVDHLGRHASRLRAPSVVGEGVIGTGMAGAGRNEQRVLHCQTCAEDHWLPGGDLRTHGHRCPLCNFEVLTVTNPITASSHYVCPHCFKKPPAQAAPESSTGYVGEMRCFQCLAACPLAGGSSFVPLRSCPRCLSGQVVVKQRKSAGGTKGGAFFSCTYNTKDRKQCDFLVWLPLGATVTKLDGGCALCGQARLACTFKISSIPPHLREPYNSVCLGGCNHSFFEVVKSANEDEERRRDTIALFSRAGRGVRGGGGHEDGGGNSGRPPLRQLAYESQASARANEVHDRLIATRPNKVETHSSFLLGFLRRVPIHCTLK